MYQNQYCTATVRLFECLLYLGRSVKENMIYPIHIILFNYLLGLYYQICPLFTLFGKVDLLMFTGSWDITQAVNIPTIKAMHSKSLIVQESSDVAENPKAVTTQSLAN